MLRYITINDKAKHNELPLHLYYWTEELQAISQFSTQICITKFSVKPSKYLRVYPLKDETFL